MNRPAVVALLALLLAAGEGRAQGFNLASGDSNAPLEVNADDGIEWQQDQQVFVARGNAVATRGDVTVRADVLRAFYRKKAGGGTDIWRLDAQGNVRIASPDQQAFGDSAVYDVDNAVLVLSGRQVRLVTARERLTAGQQIEYWEQRQMAVARGDALVVRDDRRLKADVLVAHFRTERDGRSRVQRIEAFNNVDIVTAVDAVRAERGVYNVDAELATLTGDVRLTRGENQLNGCSAEVNMRTGVSRLRGCGPGGNQQVRGLIQPVTPRSR